MLIVKLSISNVYGSFLFSGARQYKAERVSEAYAGRGEAESSASQFGRHPKDLLLSLKILATNPTYICGIIAGIVEYGLVLGFAVFLPKIIQFQFGQSATMAAIIAGEQCNNI